jgi:ABC-type multidrug transport system permease subunit
VGVELPAVVQGVLSVLPSTQAMPLILNSMTPQTVYPNAWLSYLVLVAWGIVAYLLLWWRLSRREA